LIAAALVLLAPPPAGALELEGRFAQGGLVIGRADPGAAVTVDGHAVRVSPDGLSLGGLGRDAGPSVKVWAVLPGGSVQTRAVAVRQREYETQRIDGLPSRQVTPGPEELERIRSEGAAIAEARRRDSSSPYFASGFAWPVPGPVTGVFGTRRILNGRPRSPHNGVDVAAPSGTPVKAAADGVVALARSDMFFTGQTVIIDHGHGLTTVYAHMSRLFVRPGQKVARGTPIGHVGMSGRVTGPHLHWGVALFETHLDPELLTAGE
jgi:murein DD-endopeptidase MepM/ murein hydrolase activator NlpD